MKPERQVQQLELWGGVECTINRVHEQYFDQLRRSGHVGRPSDLEHFAALGIKALRQPVLWECSPSHRSQEERWDWARASIERLGELGVRPILGLVHHGSGPRCTSLLDPEFPEKVAAYAGQVARRFPDVQDYTPVNEPLTTARFAGLYGHWYPHCRDEHSFARALLNECKAVVLAMETIRRINPAARLIQTDDLGKIYSTPALSYQAEFENERRWSTYDLLCGRVDRSHRMWHHFLWAGIPQRELEWFLDHRCPPDVIGLNHYLSGERYLDEHLERYPAETHGGNGRHRYADVLAARVLESGILGTEGVLMEAWNRYRRPIAITECHNGCTREEQLRWFLEVWRGAENSRLRGAEVIAVTAWSLVGAFDWNSLVTQKNDHYEPGVYDVRSTPPRATAIAGLIRDLAGGKKPRTPLLEVPGWWHRPCRFVYGMSVDEMGGAAPARKGSINSEYPQVKPVLITGADGRLGREFVRICELRGIPYRALSRHSLDVANVTFLRRALFEMSPWAVINADGHAGVEAGELQPQRCFRDNAQSAQLLSRECEQREIELLTFSCDLVFDGQKERPYSEADTVRPLSVYGSSKAEAERLVRREMPTALIVRSGPLFGPWDQSNFVVRALRCFTAGQPFPAANDLIVSPTYTPDLVNASLDLLIDGEGGIWHLANQGQVSWAELATMAAQFARVDWHSLQPCSVELHQRASLPRYSALTSERAILLPSLENAMRRFIDESEVPLKISESTASALAA